MKKVLGIGNALVDVLVQVESELILNELQLPKGSMQLINTERYLKIQKNASNRSISNLQRVVRWQHHSGHCQFGRTTGSHRQGGTRRNGHFFC